MHVGVSILLILKCYFSTIELQSFGNSTSYNVIVGCLVSGFLEHGFRMITEVPKLLCKDFSLFINCHKNDDGCLLFGGLNTRPTCLPWVEVCR
ncbi:hypothetical protein MIMGU_mgv11b024073mg [Erythranthe guttata]|uniref:Secreted protein n=1 Tax=Erythranthe guttata TaxID=4155 RepID=A0A022R4F6_ERYGU|nr:hypothetical protein MIMGU_mgv11b024073mg [Erythranthe guttata]